MKLNSFNKAERLCSKTLINNLFSKGNRVITQFPFRVLWQFTQSGAIPYPAQVMVSVSKRNFAIAVDRNKLKRKMRELYRVRKHLLYEALTNQQKSIIISITYQGKTHLPHNQMEQGFDLLINKVIQQIEKNT
ncbi:MAG: ribonuclease P protein component [Bacteroidia bacterium]|nr:ribonuclease P protein component [Bacteroidia bacterium]